MSTNTNRAVTVLGLGTMGSAVARTFLRHGHPTTVWNRSSPAVDDLVADGARRATSVADAVSAASCVVICVSTAGAVGELFDAAGDSVAQRVLVNLSTGSPDQARDLADRAAALDATYLDGVIQSGVQVIGTPDAQLIHSGDKRAYADCEPVLRLLGTTRYVGADAGLAAIHDAALHGLAYEVWLAYLRTLAVVAAAGIPVGSLAPAAARNLAAMAGQLPAIAGEVADRRYSAELFGTVNDHVQLVDHVIHVREIGAVDAGQLKYVKSIVERRVAGGGGADGFTSLIEEVTAP